jgi:hypothetical protein
MLSEQTIEAAGGEGHELRFRLGATDRPADALSRVMFSSEPTAAMDAGMTVWLCVVPTGPARAPTPDGWGPQRRTWQTSA